MTLAAPAFLWLLILCPLCLTAAASWLLWRSRARRRFGGIADEPLAVRAALIASPLLLIGAIALAAFAAARPQIGDGESPVDQRGIELMIVLDVSNSMLSTDAPPDRLAAAQDQIIELLEESQGDRVGLVLFAGRPFVRSPLTSDLRALAGLVEGVDEERGLLDPGSDIGSAINQAASALHNGEARSRVILIVSDGEDFGDAADTAVASAAQDGIAVYAAGVGTIDGAPVLDRDPVTGVVSARVDPETGQQVVTRLDSTGLRQIAENGGGRYISLSEDSLTSLASDFDSLDSTLFGETDATNRIERFQIFAVLALLLADIELMLVAIPRRTTAGPRGRSGAAKLWPVAASGIFVAAICGTTAADLNSTGNSRYAAGEYEESLQTYRTAQALDAKPELLANAANALNMLARYDEAIEEALRARDCVNSDPPCDAATLARIEYALGNHYVGAQRLRDALEAYRRALLADADDRDAKANYELASRWLTPSPVSTPTPSNPQGTPTAGGEGGDPSQGEEDPAAGTPGAENAGTPDATDPEELPDDPQELTDEQLARALADALAGIEEEFTPEEAQRLLDLLAEQNRRSIEDNANDIVRPELPDY